jgi:hypothetical protein
MKTKSFLIGGAVERTRTFTPCGAATSRQCVYQFRHDRILEWTPAEPSGAELRAM